MVIKAQTSIMLVFARVDIRNGELGVSPVLNQACYHPSTYNLYYVKGMLKGCYAILNAGLLGLGGQISMQVPLIDLQAQYRVIKPEIMAAIEGVLDGMQLFLRLPSQPFRHEFAPPSCCSS